ncbi:MAG: sodium:solute symporter family protein [Deltaproteobacteria bacterium]|jgi:SSS family solute:Na+ symporter|nr:sodium:solute symporter family protein [Deltaproteobacteria bacterium]MBW2534778.1 sodium:solute symporter family protein [Deltaproteobacteria bacterium]
MGRLHPIDLVMMLLYFAGVLWIGVWIMRSRKERGEGESFLAADRNMNLLQTTGSVAATDIGGGFSIAMGGLGFALGISCSWLIAMSALSIVLASFLVVPKVKRWADRVKGLTTGDLFEQRFDRRTGTTAAVVVAMAWFAFVGGQVTAGGKLLQATTGMNLTVAVLVAGAVILAYTIMGGLKAVIFTDVFQMVVLLVGIVFILVPIGLWKVGGWSAIEAHFAADPETGHMIEWTAAGPKQLVGWFLSIFPLWFIAITGLQRIIAAKDLKTARRGFLLTGIPIEWPLFAIGSTLVGMYARMLMPELADQELATPMMILRLLPVGLSGIVIAAYIAAVMSTADSCLIGPVAIVTNDLYRKLVNPQAPDRRLVQVARIATLVMGVAAIALALAVPSVLDLVLYAYTFGAAGLFFPMLGLLFWRRATAAGAFWSMVLGGASAVGWTLAGEPWGFASSYVGWPVSFLTLVIVSLATRHHPDEDVESFVGRA